MPRPKLCRRICGYPDYWSFAPEGSEPDETIPLMLDEFETIRLIDHQKLTQEECAAAMGVSRATITSIYESARYKVADAMVNGKRIRITGGTYRMDEVPAAAGIKEKGENIMRIAVTYENGMVGQHFGRTEQFKLYDIENGAMKASQVIDTNGTGHGALAGFLRSADVQTLICGGILRRHWHGREDGAAGSWRGAFARRRRQSGRCRRGLSERNAAVQSG